MAMQSFETISHTKESGGKVICKICGKDVTGKGCKQTKEMFAEMDGLFARMDSFFKKWF